jgi:hypothetical protein
MKKKKKVHTVPMAQTTVIRRLGRFSSSPHVVGAGKAPLSHVSSEGGDRGVVGRRKEETSPPTRSKRESEGCGGGIGLGRGCRMSKTCKKKKTHTLGPNDARRVVWARFSHRHPTKSSPSF